MSELMPFAQAKLTLGDIPAEHSSCSYDRLHVLHREGEQECRTGPKVTVPFAIVFYLLRKKTAMPVAKGFSCIEMPCIQSKQTLSFCPLVTSLYLLHSCISHWQ